MITLLKIVGLLPAQVWAAMVAFLLVLYGWNIVSLATTRSNLASVKLELSEYKLEQSGADNRSLIVLAERNLTLSAELDTLKSKETQYAKDILDARNRVVIATNRMRKPTAAELERDFRAAGYDRASTYASGVEGIYRSCREEYIDLGLGPDGAAEAAKAAYIQEGRANALLKALRPVPPVPPVK